MWRDRAGLSVQSALSRVTSPPPASRAAGRPLATRVEKGTGGEVDRDRLTESTLDSGLVSARIAARGEAATSPHVTGCRVGPRAGAMAPATRYPLPCTTKGERAE